jgi:Fe-S cluster assembly iron-binding protein IscA
MALDEPKEGDETFKKDGLTFIINKEVLELSKPIAVDFVSTPQGSGFRLTSSLDAGSSCGRSCSC